MLLNTRNYIAQRTLPDSVTYNGTANTLSVKDTFEQKRSFPKPTAVFAGVAKPAAKRVKTVTLADSKKADAILMLTGSMPVGIADADVDALLADLGAYCTSNEAKALFKSLTI